MDRIVIKPTAPDNNVFNRGLLKRLVVYMLLISKNTYTKKENTSSCNPKTLKYRKQKEQSYR